MTQAQVQALDGLRELLDSDDRPSEVLRIARARVRQLLDSILWMRQNASSGEPLVPIGEVFGAGPKQVVRYVIKTAKKTHTAVLILPTSCSLGKGEHPRNHVVTGSLWKALDEHLEVEILPNSRAGVFEIVYTGNEEKKG